MLKLRANPASGKFEDIAGTGTEGQVSVRKVHVRGNLKSTVECNYHRQPALYKIVTIIQNTADLKLPDPVLMDKSIIVSCQVPETFQLMPLAKDPKNHIPQSRYLMASCKSHTFKLLAFDKRKYPFYNFTSLVVEDELRKWNGGGKVSNYEGNGERSEYSEIPLIKVDV